MDIYSGEFILTILVNLIITIIGYCTLPFILRLKNGKYEYEKGHKIVIINCIVVWLIFTIIRIEQGNTTSTGAAVFLYYFVNRAILLKPKNDVTNKRECSETKMSLSSKEEIIDEKNPNLIYGEDVKVKKEQTIAKERIKEVEKEDTLVNDNKALYIIVFVLLAIIIGLSIYTVNAKIQVDDLESKISKLKSENSKLKDERDDYFIDSITNGVKADFLDENIVFVIDGYGRYYYTYDQMEQVTQGIGEYSYWAYNKEAAISKGYKAWKK